MPRSFPVPIFGDFSLVSDAAVRSWQIPQYDLPSTSRKNSGWKESPHPAQIRVGIAVGSSSSAFSSFSLLSAGMFSAVRDGVVSSSGSGTISGADSASGDNSTRISGSGSGLHSPRRSDESNRFFDWNHKQLQRHLRFLPTNM